MSDGTDQQNTQGVADENAEADTASGGAPEPSDSSDGNEQPATEDLQAPSTEKEPGDEPKAKDPEDPEPNHQAVGIGVIGGPQTDVPSAEA